VDLGRVVRLDITVEEGAPATGVAGAGGAALGTAERLKDSRRLELHAGESLPARRPDT
jgi:hypothetical protein